LAVHNKEFILGSACIDCSRAS